MAFIRIEGQKDTAVIFLARPPANAINFELAEELHARLAELCEKVPAGGMVVSGEGRMFSGGVDFKAVQNYTNEQRARMIGHINAAITALYGLPTATVAAVNGHAIGGAFVAVLACDARLAASTDAKLGLTEVTAGIPYPACPMEVVKAEIEPGLRRHLVLSGALMSPQAAHARGLIDELTPQGELLERAVALARTLASARSYATVKQQLKGDALARMRAIITASSDPMLRHWL